MLEATLRSRLQGQALRPGDDGYDRERAGWNRALDHHPALIVVAAGPDDVVAAVQYATVAGLPVAVMATGHGQAMPADGAVLISTRGLAKLKVDPDTATARIGAGVRWSSVVERAAPHGLLPLIGTAADVGAVGYLTAGGLPVLGRQFGFAADHVRSFNLVTAGGEMRHVTVESDPDLFWGVRGGKGNFGVVTEAETELVKVERLYGGGLVFNGIDTKTVLSAWVEWTAGQPEAMTSSVGLARFPDHPDVPEPMRGTFMVNVRIAFTGPAGEGARLIQPLRALRPVADTVADMPPGRIGTIYNAPTQPAPLRDRGTLLRQLDTAAIERITDLCGPDVDLPPGMVEIRQLGGALGRQPRRPSAISYRDAPFNLLVAMVAPPEAEAQIAHLQDSMLEGLQAWDTGAKLPSFLGEGETAPHQGRTAYSDADYAQLVNIKRIYDPDNLFRINHNLPPDPASRRRPPVTTAARSGAKR